jgi:hypothetical protein
VNRFMATLLRVALWSVHVSVGYAAGLDLRAPDLRSLDVQSLRQVVRSADSDETEAITIAGAPLLPEQKADTHPSTGGIASLYWAARHPTQAWRVFLPIQLDGAIAAGLATAETLTERREISAHPSPRMLASHTGGKCARRTQSGEAT